MKEGEPGSRSAHEPASPPASTSSPASALGSAPARAAAEPEVLPEPAAARALRAHALPLVALLARLHDAMPADPAALRRTLMAAVNQFEADARVSGVDEASIAAASYLLCAWGDEQFERAPWGAGGAGLLQRLHGEAQSGDRLLRLLTRLAEKPREHRALLELFHTCLSLGLRAHLAPYEGEHEALRARVHLALQQVAPAPSLVAPWQCAAAAARPPRTPRLALPAVLVLGVLALGIYTVGQLQLAARVDRVLASLQQLQPQRVPLGVAVGMPAAPPSATSTVPSRLASNLRDDIVAGRLSVRDEPLRSVVVINADALVEAGGSLTRVGAALQNLPGKVLVVGYTDGSDAPTARTPSAWHQAMEWARSVADVLRPEVGDARLALEARVGSPKNAGSAGGQASTGGKGGLGGAPLRRVEIILFPA